MNSKAGVPSGTSIPCPKCKHKFTVSAPKKEDEDDDLEVVDDDEEETSAAPPTKKAAAASTVKSKAAPRRRDPEDEDDAADRPAARKRRDEHDDDEEPRRDRRHDEADESVEKPRSKNRRRNDDDEDDTERPSKSARRRNDGDDEDGNRDRDGRRPGAAKGKSKGKGKLALIIGGIAVLLVGAGIAIYALTWSKPIRGEREVKELIKAKEAADKESDPAKKTEAQLKVLAIMMAVEDMKLTEDEQKKLLAKYKSKLDELKLGIEASWAMQNKAREESGGTNGNNPLTGPDRQSRPLPKEVPWTAAPDPAPAFELSEDARLDIALDTALWWQSRFTSTPSPFVVLIPPRTSAIEIKAQVYDLRDGKPTGMPISLPPFSMEHRRLALSSDGSALACRGPNSLRSLTIFSTATGTETSRILVGDNDKEMVIDFDFSSSDRVLTEKRHKDTLRSTLELWDAKTGQKLPDSEIKLDSNGGAHCLSPNRRYLAIFRQLDRVSIFELNSGKIVGEAIVPATAVKSGFDFGHPAFSDDGRVLSVFYGFLGKSNTRIVNFNMADGKVALDRTIPGTLEDISLASSDYPAVAWLKDGRSCLVCARVFVDIEKGRQFFKLSFEQTRGSGARSLVAGTHLARVKAEKFVMYPLPLAELEAARENPVSKKDTPVPKKVSPNPKKHSPESKLKIIAAEQGMKLDSRVEKIELSDDGSRLAVQVRQSVVIGKVNESKVQVWDIKDKLTKLCEQSGGLRALSPNGRRLVLGKGTQSDLVDVEANKVTGQIDNLSSNFAYISSDLVIASRPRGDSTPKKTSFIVKIFNATTGKEEGSFIAADDDRVSISAPFNQRREIAVGVEYSNKVRIWDVMKKELVREFEVPDANPAKAPLKGRAWRHEIPVSPDGKRLVIGKLGGTEFWWIEKGILNQTKGPPFSTRGVLLPSSDAFLLPSNMSRPRSEQNVGTLNIDIVAFDLGAQELIGSFRGHEIPISAFAASENGKVMATGDGEGNLKIWDLDKLPK
jgi:WD40 repeat protein